MRDSIWNHLGGDQTVQPIGAVNVVFGQNFYTPQHITIAAPQLLDRPWAGILYVGLSEAVTDADQKMQHLLELDLGVLGQGAGAQATQKFVHNNLGFSNNDPQGWPNQLRNEPVLTLRYQQMRRYPLTSREDLLDVVPEFGGQLGSPQTFVNAGGTLRFGYHISGLPVALIPGVATGKPVDKLEAYVFAGGDARWIPFNATLDGGLFQDGPEAPGPKRFVTDLRARRLRAVQVATPHLLRRRALERVRRPAWRDRESALRLHRVDDRAVRYVQVREVTELL